MCHWHSTGKKLMCRSQYRPLRVSTVQSKQQCGHRRKILSGHRKVFIPDTPAQCFVPLIKLLLFTVSNIAVTSSNIKEEQ